MTDIVISTDRLTKHFGSFPALEELDLEVQRGEVFGYLGPNGAGKTTTIRLLLDQIRPTHGTARIFDRDVHADSLGIRRQVGYVPGDLALYPKLTGAQTLEYFAGLRGGVDRRDVDTLAERFEADLSRKVGEYSTGNRQKIGIIQAFMHRPPLLVLDEPTAGLDPLMQQEFAALLEEVRDEGRTVFLSSHTLSEVERVADRVGIIRAGLMVVVERVDELKRKAIRRLDFEFAEPVPADLFDRVDGVREAHVDSHHARVSFEGSVNELLRAAMAYEVLNLNSREADLEEIFLTYYRDPAAGTAPSTSLASTSPASTSPPRARTATTTLDPERLDVR